MLLGVSLGISTYGYLRSADEAQFKGTLEDIMPTSDEVPGWLVTSEAIASTPEMKRAVAEILNFNDSAYHSYRNGEERVSIYVAYWKPGKMPQRQISSHTPDICWVANGWEVKRRESRVVLDHRGERRTQPAEWREMRIGDQTERVLFWHIAGRNARDLSVQPTGWRAFLSDALNGGFKQKEEQFFIRLSSNRLDAGWHTEVARTLVQKIQVSNGFPLLEKNSTSTSDK
jgi:hypothetical protein